MDITALFNLSYGVYIAATKDNDRNVGCVVNSVFQVTSSPATLAISINKDNYTSSCISKTGKFTISILSEQVDPTIIGTFGFNSSKDIDKFSEVDFALTENERLPFLTSGICAYIECRSLKTLDCFTHVLVVAEIIDAQKLHDKTPMTYSYYHKVIKGKAPQNAPTYVSPSSSSTQDQPAVNQDVYVCAVCGYEYTEGKQKFQQLDDSYQCPICGAPKSVFEPK